MPPLSKKVRDKYIEKMHRLLKDETPRMPFRHIARHLKIYSKTASRIYKEALEEKILYPPMLRPKICTDYTEYVYLINGENIRTLFERLKKDPRVEYVTLCQGTFDLLLIASQRVDLSVEKEFKSIVLSGERGNYFYPDVFRRNFYTVLEEINAFLEKGTFQPSELPSDLGKRGDEWTEREEKIFRYLKNDVRRNFTTIQKELEISRTLLLKCFSAVRKHTILSQPYFPEGYDKYTKFYLDMRTEHEQQVIDLLGKLPCQSAFFKVKDHLIAYIGSEKDATYEIFCLMSKMVSSGFVSSLTFSVPIYYSSQGYFTQE